MFFFDFCFHQYVIKNVFESEICINYVLVKLELLIGWEKGKEENTAKWNIFFERIKNK